MKYIKLNVKENTFTKAVHLICYVEGKGHKSLVYFRDGTSFDCSMSLKEIKKLFNRSWLHLVSQTILINVKRVNTLIAFNFKFVTMLDGVVHKVSERYERYFRRIEITEWRDLKR